MSTLLDEAQDFRRISAAECIASFVDPRKASRKLVLVSNESSVDQVNQTSLLQAFVGNLRVPWAWDVGARWVCGYNVEYCTLETALTFVEEDEDWKIVVPGNDFRRDFVIDHCLVSPAADMQGLCGFHYSPWLLLAVCVCTGAACALIACITFGYRNPTFALVGDALESFLETPSQPVLDRTAASRRDRHLASLEEREWRVDGRGSLWFSAVSKRSWLISMST